MTLQKSVSAKVLLFRISAQLLQLQTGVQFHNLENLESNSKVKVSENLNSKRSVVAPGFQKGTRERSERSREPIT